MTPFFCIVIVFSHAILASSILCSAMFTGSAAMLNVNYYYLAIGLASAEREQPASELYLPDW